MQEFTGIVDEMSLSYTALSTDEGRRIFVPNTTMVSTILVNRSVADPRRLVTVDLPVRLGASLSDARRVAQEAASTVPQGDELAIYVQIGEVTETTAWLHVVAYAPFGADVSHVASEIREQTVAALASADLLPPRSRRSRRDAGPHVDARRRLFHRRENSSGGRSTKAGLPVRPRWIGKYVPQWIGMTSPGSTRATASAARAGSRWPPPSPGPQPQIGIRPMSTGPSSLIPSKRRCRPRSRSISTPTRRSRPDPPRRSGSCPVVHRLHGPDLQLADPERLADLDLDHRLEPTLAQQPLPRGTTIGIDLPSFSSDGRSRWS